MLSHLAGRTRPCPRGKRQKRVSSRTGGIVPEPHQYTSMEHLPPSLEAQQDQIQQCMAQLGLRTMTVSSRKSVPGMRNGSSAEEILDNIQGLDEVQGWTQGYNGDKTQLGAQAEDTQCVHSAQGRGCSLSGCAGGRQLSPCPGAAKGAEREPRLHFGICCLGPGG